MPPGRCGRTQVDPRHNISPHAQHGADQAKDEPRHPPETLEQAVGRVEWLASHGVHFEGGPKLAQKPRAQNPEKSTRACQDSSILSQVQEIS